MPRSRTKRKKSPQTNSSRNKTSIVANPNLQVEQKKGGKGGLVKEASYYQGIVPSPEMMEHYKLVDPELPNRLVKMTEEEAVHRRKMETKLIKGSFLSDLIGLIFAFLSVVTICFLSYLFMINDYPDEGKWIVVSVVVLLAGLFITRKYKKSK